MPGHLYGELIVVDDLPGEFSDRVVECFLARPDDTLSIALSGGQTARQCYERLAAEAAEQIDWWAVDVFWGDERCVPPDHPDSNERMAREALLERVGAANSVHPMRCDEGPDRYQLKLGEVGVLDLVHLGLGADGHTASLFPASPALDADPGRLIAMTEDQTGHHSHQRMTLTLGGIGRGRQVLFTVSGEEKRAALQAIIDGEDLPAARVRAERVVWLVDQAAAPQ